jgi:hypothetical protein
MRTGCDESGDSGGGGASVKPRHYPPAPIVSIFYRTKKDTIGPPDRADAADLRAKFRIEEE